MSGTEIRSLSHAERGRLGAARRWEPVRGPLPKVAKIDDLEPAARRMVLGLIDIARREAVRNEKADAVIETPASANAEGTHDADPQT